MIYIDGEVEIDLTPSGWRSGGGAFFRHLGVVAAVLGAGAWPAGSLKDNIIMTEMKELRFGIHRVTAVIVKTKGVSDEEREKAAEEVRMALSRYFPNGEQ